MTLGVSVVVFVVATAAVVVTGPRLARIAEAIANRLEIGQVLIGAVLLGVVTSLPGLVLTVTAAARGQTELAVANALGGVAAQTMFLAIADIAYRSGTLSSRVPTRQVVFQAALLIVLLALVIIGLGTPNNHVVRVHPVTVAVVVAYGGGLVMSRRIDQQDRARAATEEADDEIEGGRGGLRGKLGELEDSPGVEREEQRSWPSLWGRFIIAALVPGAAGYALARSGADIADGTALSATSVGLIFTSVATSTPELVTAVAAARRGAIGLAAGDIIGGNTFDTLFVAAADAVSAGSAFAAAGDSALVLAGFVVLLNAVLLSGLVRQGPGAKRADVESYAIVGIWMVTAVVVVV
jgi:cation:H+ antiporter